MIRVDASAEIGTGHLMRCLVLAMQMKKSGRNIVFVCRKQIGEMGSMITDHGFRLHLLDSPANWSESWDAEKTVELFGHHFGDGIDLLVVDHYCLGFIWERRLRPFVAKILVVDDLANRKHDCDIMLDQNLYRDMEHRYRDLVPPDCIQLLGPRYALLREEFTLAAGRIHRDVQRTEKCLIFFGGSDPTGETVKTLEAIREHAGDNYLEFDVVVGQLNPQREVVERICYEAGHRYYCQIDYMAELMTKADFTIGAGGTSSWERTSLQLPSITIVTADNQLEMTAMLAELGATYSLGRQQDVSREQISEAVDHFCSHPEKLQEMSRKCAEIMAFTESGRAHGTDWSFAFDGRS